ncbi:C45 family peptidase [Marinococcus sp. PL1-022]|uniref:C45 family peptidase n=1 Tax=Marinococcus sp. PL1-022 TaxID=3095363 RepID=UPI0029C3567E|nr:C45 family peptidase [Marinococcus sp. PL1-022]MDX6153583.1 C45 family peptidase [Marinococcus sp. PL1-022]
MKEIYSSVVQFRGTHYEFGKHQGERLAGSLSVENRDKQWKIRKPRFQVDIGETKEALMKVAPGIWEELEGLQDGLKWSMEKIIMHFSGYRLEIPKSGCSIMAGDNYLVRNYDYHPKTYEGRYTLFQPADQGYAMIGPSQRVTGRMDGMNEKQLAMGYNFMHRKKPGDGFICSMIGRLILEVCASVEEAVDMLKEIPHRHSFSYVIQDRKGSSKVVEASPRGVIGRDDQTCTNHFEKMPEENRHYLVDSKARQAVMEKKKQVLPSAEEAYRLLNNTEGGVFSDNYHSWAGTIHTSGYLLQEQKAWFAIGGDQKPYEIDFSRWLNGEDIPEQYLYGQVDTDMKFLHMDHNVK